MADLQTAAGSTLYVSATAPATHDATGFAALTFSKVGKVSDLGELGEVYNEVTFNPLDESETERLAGSYTSGQIPAVFGYDADDAGQNILRNNTGNNVRLSFKLELPDGEIRYFRGRAMGKPLSIGTIDNVLTMTANINVQNGGAGFVIVAAP